MEHVGSVEEFEHYVGGWLSFKFSTDFVVKLDI